MLSVQKLRMLYQRDLELETGPQTDREGYPLCNRGTVNQVELGKPRGKQAHVNPRDQPCLHSKAISPGVHSNTNDSDSPPASR